MKRYAILLLALCSALTLTLAGCGGGGGGGGGGGEGNPTFTTTAALPAANAAATFSAAVDVNDGAGTTAAPTLAVGATDSGAATTLQAVAWPVTVTGTTVGGTPAILTTTPAGGYGRANGANNAGDIVGEMNDPVVPAFWADTATPAVALPMGVGATSGAAYDISNLGGIVGETFAVVGGPATAVFWEVDNLGVITGPTALTTAGTSSSAYAINNNPTTTEAVGEMTSATGIHAVVWRETATGIIEIVLPGSAALQLNGNAAVATSINDTGNITGEMEDALGFAHAVRWIKVANTGAPTDYTVQDLGKGTAQGINNFGRAVGQDDLGGGTAWRASAPLTPFPIGTVAPTDISMGTAINSVHRVVGIKNDQAFIALP